jgi:AcrR family transcriptional regulator
MAKRPYHHGNLRRVLLDCALGLFMDRGTFDFTFRELAREANVSHGAPYRHFASKADLLAALRAEAFSRLVGTARFAAADATSDPRTRIRLLGEAYVRFAVENPQLFQLLLQGGAPSTESDDSGFALLRNALAEARTAGVVRDDIGVKELGLAVWSLVHGLAALSASGRTPGDEAQIKRTMKLFDRLLFEGIGRVR